MKTDFSFPSCSLGELLQSSSTQFPDRPAITFMGKTLTYKQVDIVSTLFAKALQNQGFQVGDSLGVMLPNCPQYLIALFGVAKAGGKVVQLSPMSSTRELQHYLDDSGCKSLLIYTPLYAKLESVIQNANLHSLIGVDFMSTESAGIDMKGVTFCDFDSFIAEGQGEFTAPNIDPFRDVAVIQYTGGTTGLAKGAMLSHANLVANAYQNMEQLPLHLKDVSLKMLAAIPFFHVYALSVCAIMGIAQGSNLIILPRFQIDEVVETVRRYQPHYFPAVPTMLIALLASFKGKKPEGWSVDFCNIGSAPMPIETLTQFEKLTGTKLLEGYGLTEASPVTHCNTYEDRKVGSIGRVLPSTEAKIMDPIHGETEMRIGEVGELVVKGPQVMQGYLKMDQETQAVIRNGYLYTGDLARVDDEGYYFIEDRKKDLILAGGFNIYPREIEEVLYLHPGIQEAAVVGVPDPYRGETVKAFVVLKPGVILSKEELDAFCRENLSNYKTPRLYEFLESLPKTAVGKVLRRVLVEQEIAKG